VSRKSSNRLFGTVLTTAVVGLLILGSATTPAFAYLDPGSGSMLLQGILAVAAGSVIALKQHWGRVASLLGRKSRRDETDDIAG
jgi:hypothetical protein